MLVITKEAARELIRSQIALSLGLPSDEFLDQKMRDLRQKGSHEIGLGYFVACVPSEVLADGTILDEQFELDFA